MGSKAAKEEIYCIIFPPSSPPMQDRASPQGKFSQTAAAEDSWQGIHEDMIYIIQ